MFWVVDITEHTGDETKQLVDRVKSGRLVGGDVLHPALESSGLNISLRPKLDDESRLVLPSIHH